MSTYYVVFNKTKGNFFVGTGGQSGGSTAFRGAGKQIAPKLYAKVGPAKSARTVAKSYHSLKGDDIVVLPVTLQFGDPVED